MNESGSGLLVVALIVAGWFGLHEYNRANTLQKQVEDLRTKTAALVEASDNLKEQMERFQSENWRDVMPDATDAAEQVGSAKDDLQSSADTDLDGDHDE